MIPMTSEQAKLGHVSEPGSGSDLDVSFQKFNFRDDEEAGSVDLQEQVKQCDPTPTLT
jgi:hypothetical protein